MSRSLSPTTSEWKELILEQEKSNLSIDKWCQQKQLTTNRFHYWKKRLFPERYLTCSSFTELTDVKKTGIAIEYHGIRILIDRYFDQATLKRCLSILREVKC